MKLIEINNSIYEKCVLNFNSMASFDIDSKTLFEIKDITWNIEATSRILIEATSRISAAIDKVIFDEISKR